MIELVDYDQAWPDQFRQVAERLSHIAKPLELKFEHVGSTSVPGLRSKPILDIAAELQDWSQAEAIRERLEGFGYLKGDAAPGKERLFFTRTGEDGRRLVHLHLSSKASTSMRELLAFRDALRSDPALAADYQMLKQKLAMLHPNNIDAYTAAKSDFIRAALTGK